MAKFRPISEAALKKAQARAAENPTPRAISVSFNRTVDMIVERLDAKPLPLQIPWGAEADYVGMIDYDVREVLSAIGGA